MSSLSPQQYTAPSSRLTAQECAVPIAALLTFSMSWKWVGVATEPTEPSFCDWSSPHTYKSPASSTTLCADTELHLNASGEPVGATVGFAVGVAVVGMGVGRVMKDSQ